MINYNISEREKEQLGTGKWYYQYNEIINDYVASDLPGPGSIPGRVSSPG